MTSYVIKRVLLLIPTLIGVTLVVFLALRLLPGNPIQAMLGTDATPADVARLEKEFGLNRPLYVQYVAFLGQAVRGNLGDSIRQNTPVTGILAAAFPATIELAVCALILTLLIAIPLGIISAVRQNTVVDHISMVFSLLGVSMPIFWSGILLILIFSLKVHILPPFGAGLSIPGAIRVLVTEGNGAPLVNTIKHLALPTVALALNATGLVARLTRASMLEVLQQDYVRTARAKGLRELPVILRHALGNALLPIVTMVGLQFGALLGGAVITETIFSWPGVGRIVVQAINQRDFPLVQGAVLVIAAAFCVVNLCVDLLYAFMDPRIRLGNR